MLSDGVLQEFARETMTQERLVTMAWPDLSTSERLQVIQAVSGNGRPSTPDWLMKLAVSDPATIVRLWAARHHYFHKPRPEGAVMFGDPPTAEDLALTEKVSRDPNPLVAACINLPGLLSFYDDLTNLDHEVRLFAITNARAHFDIAFFKWLEKSVPVIDDRQLAECVYDFFANQSVIESLDKAGGQRDYLVELGMIDGMKKGWDLTRSAGPVLRHTLAWRLPLAIKQTAMRASDLATLPPEILNIIIARSERDLNDEIGNLFKMMREEPGKFDPSVIKSLDDESDYSGFDASEEVISRHRATERVDSSKAAISEIHRLMDQIKAFEERLVGDEEDGMPSRGSIEKLASKVNAIFWVVVVIAGYLLFRN